MAKKPRKEIIREGEKREGKMDNEGVVQPVQKRLQLKYNCRKIGESKACPW